MANIKSFPNNQDVYIGAEDVMRWLHGRSSGVFGADGNAAVYNVPGKMAVTVSDGNGWLTNANGDGIVWWNDTEAKTGKKLELTIDMAEPDLYRIDRVIVEWQTTNYVALPEIKILKGTPNVTPYFPALTNDNFLRQISLAWIEVPPAATEILSVHINDERLDPTVCGIVTEQVGVDTSVMHAQFKSFMETSINEQNTYLEAQRAAWEAFFANVQDDGLVPVPTANDAGKVPKVNKAGDGYELGDAQMSIPVTTGIPEDSDIWIDPSVSSVVAGGTCVSIDSWNDAIENGYYISRGNSPDNWLWWGYVVARDNQNIDQRIFRQGTNGLLEAHRQRIAGYWRAWKYVIPAMEVGYVYQTVELHNGKPVYTVLIDCGNFPDSNVKTVNLTDTAAAIIRYAGYASNGVALPYIEDDGTNLLWVGAGGSSITVGAKTGGWTDKNCYVQVWYTK